MKIFPLVLHGELVAEALDAVVEVQVGLTGYLSLAIHIYNLHLGLVNPLH